MNEQNTPTATVDELRNLIEQQRAQMAVEHRRLQHIESTLARIRADAGPGQQAIVRAWERPVSRAGMLGAAAAGMAGVALASGRAVAHADTPPPIPSFTSFAAPHRVFGDGSVTPAGTTTAAIDATTGGVPAGAGSAYCAVQATNPGVLTLYPDGAPDPGIANWANTGAPGQLALFYMLVPLSAAGKFRIHTYLTGQIYVDVWGYLY